jgi:hypothetical protein
VVAAGLVGLLTDLVVALAPVVAASMAPALAGSVMPVVLSPAAAPAGAMALPLRPGLWLRILDVLDRDPYVGMLLCVEEPVVLLEPVVDLPVLAAERVELAEPVVASVEAGSAPAVVLAGDGGLAADAPGADPVAVVAF